MSRTNKQLFGKFISNNLAAFSKSQWRYPAGTLLLCSVASAAYYYAKNSKENRELIDWWNQSQVNELGQRYVVREHQEKRKISADSNQDLKFEKWDMTEFREVPGMRMLWRPIDSNNPRDECEARFAEKAKKLGK